MTRTALISPLLLASCATLPDIDPEGLPAPEYLGVETNLLSDDLVQFNVELRDVRSARQIDAYTGCAAAQYALIRDFGFARHLRTNVTEKGGVWSADAVYTISPEQPRGSRTLDADVVVADCKENGIPTV